MTYDPNTLRPNKILIKVVMTLVLVLEDSLILKPLIFRQPSITIA
jgi:hypothetical protein